jgi:metal-responsive CopG/Arc/MetJ family transcriptional regulator
MNSAVAKLAKTKRISVAVDPSVLQEINRITNKSSINRSALMRQLVEDWVSQRKQSGVDAVLTSMSLVNNRNLPD